MQPNIVLRPPSEPNTMPNEIIREYLTVIVRVADIIHAYLMMSFTNETSLVVRELVLFWRVYGIVSSRGGYDG